MYSNLSKGEQTALEDLQERGNIVMLTPIMEEQYLS